MSSNPLHGSPGAPHLSYSTPATGRRSSYASVAAGGSSAPFTTHENVPSPFNSARGVSLGSAPSGHFQRLPTTENTTSRTQQLTAELDAQADGLVPIPSSWGKESGSMANNTNARHGRQRSGMETGYEQQHDNFFIPSYLRESRYIEKLETARRAKIAAQRAESASRTFNAGSLSTSSSTVSLQKMAPSHRGMTYDIIENQLLVEDEGPAPLPSKWKSKDKWGGLEIMATETDVRFVGLANKLSEHEAAAARTDHPMPPECGVYYYEVTIVNKGKDGMIGVGFSGSKASLEKLPGWEPDSWGYHGDDGMSFCCQSTGKTYAEQFTTNDVIGCGVDFDTNQAFFTKNGVFLGFAFREIRNVKLYPSVGMKRPQAYVTANFGQRPFTFDIDGHLKEKKLKIRREIDAIATDSLSRLTKGDIAKALVAQYLSHDGYNETAKAFSQEIRSENQALLGTFNSSLDPFLVADDDDDAAHRQTIRAAILDGDIELAISLITSYYPDIFAQNPAIYFQLRCRKFIELMRKISEHINETPAKRLSVNRPFIGMGTAYFADGPREMDFGKVPQGVRFVPHPNKPWEEAMDTEESVPVPAISQDLDQRHKEHLKEAVEYGKELKQDFKADQSPLVTETMTKIFGMMAYKDPAQSDQAYLLETSQRTPVAEAVNSAILVLLGKPPSTTLETLYKQTAVLLDLTSSSGGSPALISLKSILASASDPFIDVNLSDYPSMYPQAHSLESQ